MIHAIAREGQWYLQRWSREAFCVIGVDEDFKVIDVRDANGDIDEFAFDEWETMDLEVCAAPQPQGFEGDFDGEDGELIGGEPPNSGPVHGPRFGSD